MLMANIASRPDYLARVSSRHGIPMQHNWSHSSAGFRGPQQVHAPSVCRDFQARQRREVGLRVRRRIKDQWGVVHTAAGDVNTPKSAADDVSYLMHQCGAVGNVTAEEGKHGLGLFATCGATKGDTLLRIPESACLIVDYEQGIQLPAQAWPRLHKGLQRKQALPWDILLGLALLDALDGDGGAFWEEYAGRVLPQPASLSVPFCLPPRLLAELQHPEIRDGAAKQQDRLTGLFPGLATPMGEDSSTTYMQWGLACVRSRAFQMGKDRFAFVPFLDICNHSPAPNAAFRASESGAAIELVAVADVDQGQEAVICYTERNGTTNMRMMQQYGFVLSGGNPADRIILPSSQSAGSSLPALSIQHMEEVLGDRVFVDIMGGRQHRLVAAMKSLPLRDDDEPANSSPAERDLVALLTRECSTQLEACATSVEEDNAACKAAEAENNGKMEMIIRYRMERKLLLQAMRDLLLLYTG